ncbi:hypothetical protein DFH08DRAFT_659042, partial [Mycena albidolilacea]
MLIWIKGALSPQEIRTRLLDENSEFQKEMIAYLESSHVGEFLTGTIAEVKAKVPYRNYHKKGLHEVIDDEATQHVPISYTDPTQTLPVKPPPLCEDCTEPLCENCAASAKWWRDYEETVDDLILRSNVHTC